MGNEMNACNQCGECCKYVAIKILGQDGLPVEDDDDFLDWVSCRGLDYTKDGWLVIDTECPNLRYDTDLDKFVCSVHLRKPVYCKRYPIGDTWKPKECIL